MARINIEDTIFKDRRFYDLVVAVKDFDRALGMLVRAWIVAQRWFLTENRTIPVGEWVKEKLSDNLIDVGLVKKTENGMWVCGANEQFNWLIQTQAAGRASAESRRNKTGSKAATPVNARSTPVNGPSTSYSFSISYKKNTEEEGGILSVEGVRPETTAGWLKKYQDPEWIVDELYKALEWNEAHPPKTGKPRLMGSFLSRWLENGKKYRDQSPTVTISKKKVSMDDFGEVQ